MYKVKGVSAFNWLLYEYRRGSSSRGLEFSLSIKEFARLTKLPCYYCGGLPCMVKKRHRFSYVYNGVDRKDNNKGYTKANSVACCHRCNMAKGAMSIDEFYGWIESVHKHSFR